MRNRQKPDNRIDLHHCNNTKQVTYLLSLHPFQEAYPWICPVSLGWLCLMLTTPDPSSNPASACGLTDLQPLAPGPPGLSVWSPMLSHPQLLAHLSLLTCLPLTQASKSFCVSQWTLVASCHKALSCHQSLLRLSHLCLEKPPRSPPGCSSQPLPLPPLTPSHGSQTQLP